MILNQDMLDYKTNVFGVKMVREMVTELPVNSFRLGRLGVFALKGLQEKHGRTISIMQKCIRRLTKSVQKKYR